MVKMPGLGHSTAAHQFVCLYCLVVLQLLLLFLRSNFHGLAVVRALGRAMRSAYYQLLA